MSVKRLLDCTPSELARYTKAELLAAGQVADSALASAHQA